LDFHQIMTQKDENYEVKSSSITKHMVFCHTNHDIQLIIHLANQLVIHYEMGYHPTNLQIQLI
jgi:hypothetical protein